MAASQTGNKLCLSGIRRARTSAACGDENAARRQVACRQRHYCAPDPGLEVWRQLSVCVHGVWRSIPETPWKGVTSHACVRFLLVIEMGDLGPRYAQHVHFAHAAKAD